MIKNIIKKSVSFIMGIIIMTVYIPILNTIETFAVSNEEIIYDFLVNNIGMNSAQACAGLANIYKESSFNNKLSIIDTNGKRSYGICQWNGDRYEKLKSWCGNNGYNYQSIEGQLNYLKYEFHNDENKAYKLIIQYPDTQQGCYDASYCWAEKFERCTHYYNGTNQYTSRANFAVNKYWSVYGKKPPVPVTPDNNGEYYPACSTGYYSIVEALKSINVDSSMSFRKSIAAANGISNYSGTAAQNTNMLNLLKAGQLRKAGSSPVVNPTPTPDPTPTPSYNTYYPACDSNYTSIVDALKSIGVDSGKDNRSRIAAANGISNYSGTAEQNSTMLSKLKSGSLINPDSAPIVTTTPSTTPLAPVNKIEYYPACDSSYTSIVDALKSIGVDSSKDNRSKIAAVNGISNYSGTAEQNIQLLSLLKNGKLATGNVIVVTTTVPETTTTIKITAATTKTTTTTATTATTTTTTVSAHPVVIPEELTLEVGQSVELIVENVADTTDIVWISTDKDIAEVDDKIVKAISPGKVKIYAVVNKTYCEVKITVEDVFDISASDILYGDLNYDEIITVDDLIILREYILGYTEYSDDLFILGDMNQDDVVDIYDMVLLRQRIETF
ncbi:MAG: Ig-like domain-containing protein [Ruminococcus sp.]|nr:Ig-like domain-containing protein [Ruminococcus sp.]